jgi:hypothetical protein
MLKTVLKFAVSGLLIWWLVSNVDIADVGRAVLSADTAFLFAALFLLLAMSALQAVRWSLIARILDIQPSFLKGWGIILIGNFFNQALPSIVGGDAIRVYLLQQSGFPVAPSISSVVLDRVVAFIGLVVVVALGQPIMFELIGDQPLRWGMPLVVALGALLFIAAPTIDLLPLPGFVARSVVARGIGRFAIDARKVLLTPAGIFPALALALAGHVGLSISVFLIALAVGIEVTLVHVLVLFPPVFLLSTLPISIAGWGVREGALVTAFSLIGVDEASALAVSILFGVGGLLAAIPGGFVWLVHKGRKEIADTP